MIFIKYDKDFKVVYLNYDVDENNELYLKHKIKKNKELIKFLELIN